VDHFPEQIGKLEKEGQNDYEEGRVGLLISFLFLNTSINGEKEYRSEDEEKYQMKAKAPLVFIAEMIYLFSFSNLSNDVEVYFNFRHHFMALVSVMLAVHNNEEVYSWHVLIVKHNSCVFPP
jgi:hypothetical protein